MPETEQIYFTHKELVTLLVKEANIHEGRWMLLMNFNMQIGNMQDTGEESADAFPGGALTVRKIGLARVTSDGPRNLSVDAAIVNPLP